MSRYVRPQSMSGSGEDISRWNWIFDSAPHSPSRLSRRCSSVFENQQKQPRAGGRDGWGKSDLGTNHPRENHSLKIGSHFLVPRIEYISGQHWYCLLNTIFFNIRSISWNFFRGFSEAKPRAICNRRICFSRQIRGKHRNWVKYCKYLTKIFYIWNILPPCQAGTCPNIV